MRGVMFEASVCLSVCLFLFICDFNVFFKLFKATLIESSGGVMDKASSSHSRGRGFKSWPVPMNSFNYIFN